ncbi:OB-fold nucleic acid binding domain-containing protein [Nanchangia anserum]|uniref:OB-fold nucleic acid binding domain-containing protein n=1 Tax=Nanchangia anserum TaxID=2692125 RepID=A0A8I0G7Z8_9ACTO|nr:OB-fold nucleic acid binding domain-containing protein [Nanchangia anserum]MBD3688829.1 OB-fold nucleic acid binding domain-containing protein [Nanchangia anserum]QOX81104.1 OB-fold nucleic acid binding domain-containing protein [Nanchangia anserum]
MGIRERFRRSANRMEADAGEQQRLSAARDAVPVRDVQLRSRVRVCGVLRALTYPAPGAGGSFKATLWDGTGTIDLIWLGQSRVEGIRPGLNVIASGVVAERGGVTCIYNPAYEVITP